ncbi:MAG: efflux RND transporter permease subunit [Desulfobacterales bacterium]
MSFITRFALNTNRITMIFIILTIIVGIRQFAAFPRQEDPPITIREVVVYAFFPGMNTYDIEQLVTRKIEAQLRTLPEIEDIWSDSKTGKVIVHADTRDEYDDLDLIWQKIRNKMADLRPELPEGTVGPFVNDEFGLTAVATIALTAEGFSMAEMRPVARDIRDWLYDLQGIRKVELWGIQEEQIFLKYSSTTLYQKGIGIGQIIDALVQQNVVLPGGVVDAEGRDLIIEPSGTFRSVEDIERVFIKIPGTQKSAQLKDLLTVERAYVDPPKNLAYFNGRPAIVISVSITPGINAVEFGHRLTGKIQEIESFLPIGYALEYATFQPELVQKAVQGALSNVYQTLVIVLVVVMLFLGIRTGLIVGSFVPMTMLLGLIVMRYINVELERVSIASAIIALGMLVDNGIVVAEDVRSRLEAGEEKKQACIEAGRTLAIPLLTSSLTTILAFMPMLLVEGSTGDYIFSLPMVVIILLLSSWFLSMFMTPVMCFWFMKAKPVAGAQEASQSDAAAGFDQYSGKFYRVYRMALEYVLRFRYAVLGFTIIMFVLGGLAASFLVREFFGASDRNQLLVYVDLPAGDNIRTSDNVVQRLTAWLSDKQQNPEITSTIAYVATGGPRFFLALSPFDPDPNRGFLIVNTENDAQVPEVVQRVRGYFLSDIPEAEGRVKQMWLGGTEPGLVEIRLIGPDAEYLYVKGKKLLTELNRIPGVLDVRSDWENKVVKTVITVDQARARRARVTSRDVANSLESHLSGVKVTEYREADEAIPVLIRSNDEERDTIGDLRNMTVYSTTDGTTVPGSQVAGGISTWELSRISHRNQMRTLTVELKHEALKAPQLLEAIRPWIESLDLKEGYRWEVGGEIEKANESNENLRRFLPPCLLGIVILLIWQFNSFRRPAIIFITIPLAFAGALIGVLIFGAPFDFFGILGLLSLAGVIINNGIVLIDRIEIERQRGLDPYQAVIQSAVSRFRPILMTTITTILGVMPLILWRDPLFYTLSIIIASGLAFGTVLTLGVAPVLYAIFFRVKENV